MQPTNSNDSESQEWKKKKGFLPTLLSAFVVLVVVLFLSNSSRPRQPGMMQDTITTESSSAAVLRGFEADVVIASGDPRCAPAVCKSACECLVANCGTFSGRCARDKVCSVILSKINQCKCDGGKTNVPCITAAINGDTSKLVTDLVSCGKKFCNN